MPLDRKKHYLQVALNSTLEEARQIIAALPYSDRILIEAGTPLIKRYGTEGIEKLRLYWSQKSNPLAPVVGKKLSGVKTGGLLDVLMLLLNPELSTLSQKKPVALSQSKNAIAPYIVADLKCMDRGEAEVTLAAQAGASAAVVLGSAPIETINRFISHCQKLGIDAMVDMMAIDQPIKILRRLKKMPAVVILHRGVDETADNKTKTLPIHQINKVKGTANVLIAVAGGDTPRDVQSAVFNGADIVVVWKNFYQASDSTAQLAESFLKNIK